MNYTASLIKTSVLYLGCCIFFTLITTAATAQTRGKVEVIKDSRIDTLIAKRLTLKSGTKTASSPYSTRGYRVQFYSGSSRKEAFDAQAQFQAKYPDIRTYITYSEPNFKVKAGDFRFRLEASKLVQEIRPWFRVLFIIPERINPPKLETSND